LWIRLGSLSFLALVGFFLFFSAKKDPTPPQEKPARKAISTMEKHLALAPLSEKTPLDKLISQRQRSASRQPQKADLWVLLGRAWVMKARSTADPGYYSNALACAKIALSLEPQSAPALTLQGLAWMNDHAFRKARDLAKEILARDPQEMMALAILSDASLELGDEQAAQEAAQKMLDFKPSLPAYSRLSYLMWLRGATKEAKEAMRLAIDAGRSKRDREPGTWAILQAALYFWHEGDYQGARAGTEMALKYFPAYPHAQATHGKVLLSLNLPNEAITHLHLAFHQAPLAEIAWWLVEAHRESAAQAHEPTKREKHLQQAQYYLREVIRLGRQGDHRTLALFLATEDRDLEEALRLIEGEYKERKDIYTTDAYGWVLYRLKRYREAAALAEASLRLGTPDALLKYHAGAIFLAAGQRQRGLTLLRQAQKQHPRLLPALSRFADRLLAQENPSPPSSQPLLNDRRSPLPPLQDKPKNNALPAPSSRPLSKPSTSK
jgi:tetratricopeptide (TPR) repeat protein